MNARGADDHDRYDAEGLDADAEQLYRALLTARRAPRADECSFEGRPLRSLHGADGTLYCYVALDARDACIVSVEPAGDTLVMPDEVDGLRVRALGARAFSSVRFIDRIVLPPRCIDVGLQAFCGCRSLRSVVFSPLGATFDRAAFRDSSHLVELVLPGRLACVTASDIDMPSLRVLSLGAGTRRIDDLAFSRTSLSRIEVDPGNPWLRTDGRAVFSKDGDVLFALAVRGSSYDIPPGTRVVGRKAFAYDSQLASVTFPEGLQEIGAFAFFETGLTSFSAPSTLTVIRAKAFYQCASLSRADVGSRLSRLGAEAFARSALAELSLPATLRHIGRDVIALTPAAQRFDRPRLTIDAANPYLAADAEGGVYERGESGLVLLNYLGTSDSFVALPRTAAVAPRAFLRSPSIRSASFPDGLVSIGEAAFSGCARLAEVDLPDSVVDIAAEAFAGTSLARFRVPARCDHIGVVALSTGATFRSGCASTIESISVSPENKVFFLLGSLLCERMANGEASALLWAGTERIVEIPRQITAIGAYAFSGAVGIEELRLHSGIRSVELRGLSIGCVPRRIAIDLVRPASPCDRVVAHYPACDRALHILQAALRPSSIRPDLIMDGADAAMQRYGTLEERAFMAVDRLSNPVYLSQVHRERYEKLLATRLVDVARVLARRNAFARLDALADLGYLTEETIVAVVDALIDDGDVAMTGHLLEMKRRRFGGSRFDFEL